MKKQFFMMLALAVFSVGTVFAGEPVDPPAKTKTITYKELKAQYGEVANTNGIQLQDEDLVTIVDQESAAKPPCGGQPCRRAIVTQTRQLQASADACCCTIIAGIICCENGNTVEYLIAIDPKNCN